MRATCEPISPDPITNVVIAFSLLLLRCSLSDPLDQQVGDLETVLVEHHHVRVPSYSMRRQQQQGGISRAFLQGIDGRDAPVSSRISIEADRTFAVIAPNREERNLFECSIELGVRDWCTIAFDIDQTGDLGAVAHEVEP